jgi:hypothetical protein
VVRIAVIGHRGHAGSINKGFMELKEKDLINK